ncbi:MAG TPA: 6-carboxytetrahydropterin synthase [Armatimonadota bacterium]|jgi:6-pyruvoyltetrahydropterin/6-carboxytetrahydropterin synthase
MIVNLTRQATFSAAHACRLEGASEEENRRVFGSASRVHGHNYRVEATLRGTLDPRTGMVLNMNQVKAALAEATAPLANAWIDRDVPHFQRQPSTTENLVLYLWGRLLASDLCGALVSLKVAESPDLCSEYRGMADRTVFVTRAYEFSAAHRLHASGLSDEENAEVFGKCNNPAGHGHNYGLEVTVRGPVDPRRGTAFDLASLDAVVQDRVVARFDHRNLNVDVPEMGGLNPTSENLAVVLWGILREALGDALYSVRVVETARNTFEYRGE